MSVEEHKAKGKRSIHCFVVTVSDTRDEATDTSGQLIKSMLADENHRLAGYRIVKDYLSYQDIGSAAVMSRAVAGSAQGKVLISLPGSRGAVGLAMEKLILPELRHMVSQLQGK